MKPFLWNAEREALALALAKGETIEAAIRAVGVSKATAWRWRNYPEFQERVAAEAEAIRAAIRAEGITNKQNRLDALNERHRKMTEVIVARAKANQWRERVEQVDEDDDFDFQGYTAAGAETGLMAHTVTYLKDGRREEWAVDVGLLKEMRETEKQAAQEMGQWTEKREDTVNTTAAVRITTIVVEKPAGIEDA